MTFRSLVAAAAALALAAGCTTLTPEQRADRRDAAGSEALSGDKPCEALADFREALALQPESWRELRHEVAAARGCGQLGKVTARARERVKSEPESARAHYQLGLALLAGERGEKEGLAELALARKLDPRSAEPALRYGFALVESERYAEAIAPLRAAIALAPDDPHARFPLALALHRTGHDAEAVAAIAEALQHTPSADDLAKARALLDVIHDPYRPIPAGAKPRFQEAMGWLDRDDASQRAVDVLESLASDFPQVPIFYSALGLAYEKLGDTSQAVEHFEQAIALDPTLPGPHFYLGEVYHGLQKYGQAEAQYRAALAQDPLLEAARDRLGEMEFDEGDGKDAVAQLRALVAIRHGDPKTRLRLASALSLVGDLPGADRELQAVLKKDPKNLAAQLGLGGIDVQRALEAKAPDVRRQFADAARKRLHDVLAQQPDNAAATRLLAALDAPQK